ncbi:MAG: O-antigen ligase family protein [Armatimonadota bacterium]
MKAPEGAVLEVWLGETPWYRRPGVVGFTVVAVSIALGIAALFVPWQVFAGLVAGVVVLTLAWRSAYVGLLIATAWVYVRPDEFVPGLHHLHMQKVLVLVVLAAMFMKRDARKPIFGPGAAQTWALLGILAVVAASVPLALWKGAAFGTLDRLVRYSVYYFVALALVIDVPRLRGYVWTLISASAFLAVAAFHNYRTGDVVLSGELQRATGVNAMFQDPNDLAAAMTMALPLAYYSIWSAKSLAGRLTALGSAAVLVFGVVLTGSRSGTVTVALLYLLILCRTPRRGLVVLLGSAMLVGFWFGASPQYRERILSIGKPSKEGLEDPSVVIRREAWAAGRRMFWEHPLIGVGAGNFPNAWAELYTNELDRPFWKNAHSLYYQMAGELGVAGIAAWGVLVFTVFRDNRRVRRRLRQSGAGGDYLRYVTYGVDAGMISLLSNGLFLSILYYPFIFTLASLTAVLIRLSHELEVASAEERQELCVASAAS